MVWNSLSDDLRAQQDYESFRQRLKTWRVQRIRNFVTIALYKFIFTITITITITTNRKSHTVFRLVPTSVTLNDIERRNSPYFVLFRRIR